MSKILGNLKIGKKLFIGYAILILFASGLAVSNVFAMLSIHETYLELHSSTVAEKQLLMQMNTDFANARRYLVLVAYGVGDNTEKNNLIKFDDTIAKVNSTGLLLISSLEKDPNIKTDAERKEVIGLAQDVLDSITMEYSLVRREIESNLAKGNLNDIENSIANASDIGSKITGKFDKILEMATQKVAEVTNETTEIMYSNIFALSLFGIIVIITSIILASIISKSIRRPIINLSNNASEVAKGNLGVAVRCDSKDEIGMLSNAFGDVVDKFSLLAGAINKAYEELKDGKLGVTMDEQVFPGDYKIVASAVNNTISYIEGGTRSAIACAQAYANGDFETSVKRYSGDQALLNDIFDTLQNNLKMVSKDLNDLIENVVKGNLNVEIDVKNYKGDWAKIASGFNTLLKTVEVPISEVCSVLEQVSEGKFVSSVTGKYNGIFALMRDSVNRTIEVSSTYIKDISDILVKISSQNLDIKISKDYKGDFAAIKEALIQIVETFNKIIIEFKASAEQVAVGAKQISESSVILSQGAVEQASALEKTASTSGIISKQASVNAQNAEEVRLLTLEAKEKGLESKVDMEEMLQSMTDIHNASINISKIIKVIDDIAFQINLLALNAAVEAAHADAHGKGFSVVAEEVRNLAVKSKQAASETASLISHTAEIVTNGTRIANNTAETLNKIVDQITDIAELIEGISSSSKDQNEAVYQINESIAQISGVTQTNTATAEESASMSEELASQAELLKNALAQFKHKTN